MKFSTLLTLFLFSLSVYSQSINSYLNSEERTDFRSEKLVEEVKIDQLFYNSSGIETKIEVISYNFQNKDIISNRYDENKILKQRLTRLYDATGTRIISTRLDNWHSLIGHFYDTKYYYYDTNGFLSKIFEKDSNNNIIRQTFIINNEKGNPLELSIVEGDQIIAKETAEYNYEQNEVVIKYFTGSDELLNTDLRRISYTERESNDIINEYGDIVKTNAYQNNIKYDKYGNWIKKVYFKIENGKLVKKTQQVRSIKYRK